MNMKSNTEKPMNQLSSECPFVIVVTGSTQNQMLKSPMFIFTLEVVLPLGPRKGQRLMLKLPSPQRMGSSNISLCDSLFLIPRASPRECCLPLMRFSPILKEKKIISPLTIYNEGPTFIQIWNSNLYYLHDPVSPHLTLDKRLLTQAEIAVRFKCHTPLQRLQRNFTDKTLQNTNSQRKIQISGHK